jgi:nitroreductase
MGAAVQNILLGAHAMGFGGGLTSGRAMNSPRLHALLQLGADDVPVCCVNIGTVSKRKPAPPRPESGHFLRQL